MRIYLNCKAFLLYFDYLIAIGFLTTNTTNRMLLFQKNISLIIYCGVIFFLGACNTSGSSSDEFLPQAKGAEGELVMVMDSLLVDTKVGDELEKIFLAYIPGLPQNEPYFTVRRVDPFSLNNILRSAKNMVFITTFDNNSRSGRKLQDFWTSNSVERLREDPDLFMYYKKNEFAKGQEVLHLFGLTADSLASKLAENRERIRDHFHEIEVQRIANRLFSAKTETGISNAMLEKHQAFMKIPFGYEVSKNEQNFMWIRQLDPEVDKSLIITYKDYVSEDAFSAESIRAYRDQLTQKYIADDSTVHMTTEKLVPLSTKTINLNGKYATEARGLWKLTNNTMGGGFLSYTFVDEELGRLYYIEGFIYCPGKKKRPHIREMEAILKTFRTSSELKQQSAS